jgi:hypothetical protein
LSEALAKFIEHMAWGSWAGAAGRRRSTSGCWRTGGPIKQGDSPLPESRPEPACESLYSPTEYRQDNSFLIVGERMNASGSRKFKQLLEARTGTGWCRWRASRCGTMARTCWT